MYLPTLVMLSGIPGVIPGSHDGEVSDQVPTHIHLHLMQLVGSVGAWCTIPLAYTTWGLVLRTTSAPLPYSVPIRCTGERTSEGLYSGVIHGSPHTDGIPKSSLDIHSLHLYL